MLYTGSLQERFFVDGVEFVVDISPGKNRRPSEPGSFTLVKTPAMISTYLKLAEDRDRFRSILELGVFQGGSLVLMDRLLKPDTLVAVELDSPFPAIQHYCDEQDRNIRVAFETSQSDSDAIGEILRNDFPTGIDLVVDDASHVYSHTKASFELLFPHVRAGGVYLIEDWAWSHAPPYQNKDNNWYKQPALTNLVFELIVELGSQAAIESITIDRGQMLITKARDLEPPFTLQRLRGRKLPQI